MVRIPTAEARTSRAGSQRRRHDKAGVNAGDPQGMKGNREGSKLLPLEALRGGASMLVALYHFLLAFAPGVVGILPRVDNSHALVGTPWFAFVNGTAHVTTFFVLSGFVLSLKGLRENPTAAILDAAVKRWFRLAPIVCLSVLLSWALFHLGWFHFEDAAKLSRSDWLQHFGYGNLPQTYQPGIFEALWQGSFTTFVFGKRSLNSNLWTMIWEFYGSFMVFALAFLLRPRLRWLLWLLLVAAAAGLLLYPKSYLVPFLFGVAATALGIHRLKLNLPMAVLGLVGGLYLCGYWLPSGWYFWAQFLPFATEERAIVILSLGAFLLLVTFSSHNPMTAHLKGPVSRWLGNISFPLYLVHTLVITSLASLVYAHVGGGTTGLWLAALTTIAGCIPLVFVFALFDRWWMTVLRRWIIFRQ